MAKSRQTARKPVVETFVDVQVDVKKAARKAGCTLRSQETRRLRMGKIRGKVFKMVGDKDKGECADFNFIYCI